MNSSSAFTGGGKKRGLADAEPRDSVNNPEKSSAKKVKLDEEEKLDEQEEEEDIAVPVFAVIYEQAFGSARKEDTLAMMGVYTSELRIRRRQNASRCLFG